MSLNLQHGLFMQILEVFIIKKTDIGTKITEDSQENNAE